MKKDSAQPFPDTAHFDVVIIGAGVNGAGLFRELCLQGLSCLIVDKGDYGSGTSAAPSRLIHGGIKYLETGEFGLVSESTLERNLLLKNAPHVVKPLPTLIPVRSWTGGIWSAVKTFFGYKTSFKSRGMILIKVGLMLYDLFGRHERSMPKHSTLSKAQAARSMPSLTRDIVGIGTYHDAMITEPERLILELIEDGLSANTQSVALNYTPLVGCTEDALVFQHVSGEAQLSCTGKVIINAAGPWIDRVNWALGHDTKMVGGTKGSHILMDHDPLVAQLKGRMVYFEGDDGRILLVFEYHGRALVGSTDIPADDPDNLHCTPEEVAYFLEGLNALFPGLSFSPDQIVYSYAGLRPLPNSEGVDPGLISRDHSTPTLEVDSAPIISLVGGKWTTFRGFAQSVTDDVLKRLNRTRTISTLDLAIGGGRGFPTNAGSFDATLSQMHEETGCDTGLLGLLMNRYGFEKALKIAFKIAPEKANAPLIADLYHPEEIRWIAVNENVWSLEDVMFRRTQLAVTGKASREIDAVATIVGNALHWSDDRNKSERAQVLALLEARHGL